VQLTVKLDFPLGAIICGLSASLIFRTLLLCAFQTCLDGQFERQTVSAVGGGNSAFHGAA
jgi:thioredoxin reductase